MNLFEQKLRELYPSGFIGGQCAVWAEQVFDFGPVGDSVQKKMDFVARDGNCKTAAQIYSPLGWGGYRIGDVIFTSEGCKSSFWHGLTGNGHVAIVMDLDKDGNPILAESNFKLDERVYYGRVFDKQSPKLLGVGRFPFKIDLEIEKVKLNYDLFVNKPLSPYKGQIFDDTAFLISDYNPHLDVSFFLEVTAFKNWWYQYFPFNGVVYKVIAQAYLQEMANIYGFTSQNKQADLMAFIINSKEWQGTVSNGAQEYGWTFCQKPGLIQICSDPDTKSPWYDMPLVQHALIHELGHYLSWLSGQWQDNTDFNDITNHNLKGVLSGLDINRVFLNL